MPPTRRPTTTKTNQRSQTTASASTSTSKSTTTKRATISKPKPKPPPRTTKADFPTLSFATPRDFETYLDTHHSTTPGVNILLAKKHTGIPSITHHEAIEVALMFGWIDGGGHGVDASYWITRYLPRKPKSTWSKRNVDTVDRHIEKGRMREAGMRVVEAARADGRWERAYPGMKDMVVPEDFGEALRGCPEAGEVWEGMGRGDRYMMLMRLVSVVPRNRAGMIEKLVGGLAARGERGEGVTRRDAEEARGSESVGETARKRAGVEKVRAESTGRQNGEVESRIEHVIPGAADNLRRSERVALSSHAR